MKAIAQKLPVLYTELVLSKPFLKPQHKAAKAPAHLPAAAERMVTTTGIPSSTAVAGDAVSPAARVDTRLHAGAEMNDFIMPVRLVLLVVKPLLPYRQRWTLPSC